MANESTQNAQDTQTHQTQRNTSASITKAIVPIKLSLLQGDVYTLWAQSWREHGTQWQAFLGDNTSVLGFHSPAAVLAFIESDAQHDLLSHPKWSAFNQTDNAAFVTRVVPEARREYDLIGVPAMLAGDPILDNVAGVSGAFDVAKSLAAVCSLNDVLSFFSAHSILDNLHRGVEHYSGDYGTSEWTGVGRIVATNWKRIMESLDTAVRIQEVDADRVKDAQDRIDAALEEQKKREEESQSSPETEEDVQEESAPLDPYDTTLWATAGIDPIRITIDGRTLYTLRTYVNGRAQFLGKFGQIYTFTNRKSMPRWLAEHNDHDLADLSTWPQIMDDVNGGTCTITVHPDNSYSFTGLIDDIKKGPNAVDTNQMRRAYELLADAADWAADDSVNSILLAHPGLQDYLAYMLGSSSSYIPDPPYTTEVAGWRAFEESLTSRFTK